MRGVLLGVPVSSELPLSVAIHLTEHHHVMSPARESNVSVAHLSLESGPSTHSKISNIKTINGEPSSIIRGGIFLSSRSGNILNKAKTGITTIHTKRRLGKGGVINMNKKKTEKNKQAEEKQKKTTSHKHRKRSQLMT